jgi:Fatty acid hydroxylase superfamily
VRPFTLLNGNILLMAFLITYGHLRHSHMWIAFTGFAGRILQSPAHHQLHHSADPVHYDRNLGFALAVWDWAFGTLVVPARSRERIVFGLGVEAPPFRSALEAFAVPCVRCAEHAWRFAQRFSGSLWVASAARTPMAIARQRASRTPVSRRAIAKQSEGS